MTDTTILRAEIESRFADDDETSILTLLDYHLNEGDSAVIIVFPKKNIEQAIIRGFHVRLISDDFEEIIIPDMGKFEDWDLGIDLVAQLIDSARTKLCGGEA